MQKLILVLLLVMSFQVLPVRAQEKVASIPQETEEVVKQKRNIFEEFHYRVFLKDTRDFFDFVLLGIFITGLLIVLVFKNTHYVVVQKSLEAKTFLETGNVYSVDEIETPTELVNAEEENTEEVAEIVENSEILSSEDLEEEVEEVPRKKDKKKKRA